MSAARLRTGGALLPLALAGCVPAAQPPRAPAAPAPPPPAAAAATTVAPRAGDWRDLAVAPGGWSYAREADATVARFGRPGVAPDLAISCRTATRQVAIVRLGAAAGPLTLTTSYGDARWPATAMEGGAGVVIAAADPALDRLAFSRGRFSVSATGAPLLVVPTWAEPARVVEDCRG